MLKNAFHSTQWWDGPKLTNVPWVFLFRDPHSICVPPLINNPPPSPYHLQDFPEVTPELRTAFVYNVPPGPGAEAEWAALTTFSTSFRMFGRSNIDVGEAELMRALLGLSSCSLDGLLNKSCRKAWTYSAEQSSRPLRLSPSSCFVQPKGLTMNAVHFLALSYSSPVAFCSLDTEYTVRKCGQKGEHRGPLMCTGLLRLSCSLTWVAAVVSSLRWCCAVFAVQHGD